MEMMKISLLLWCVIVGCASVAQQSSDVIRVEFSSLARGYQELLVMTSDSIQYSKTEMRQQPVNKPGKMTNEAWAEVIKSLQQVSLTEVPELESPSMKRTYDGARHSTITITTKSNQTYTHSFDDEDPHQKLKQLMKQIQKVRSKK